MYYIKGLTSAKCDSFFYNVHLQLVFSKYSIEIHNKIFATKISTKVKNKVILDITFWYEDISAAQVLNEIIGKHNMPTLCKIPLDILKNFVALTDVKMTFMALLFYCSEPFKNHWALQKSDQI